MKIKPFLKWVGGKTQLEKRMPKEFKNYFEPFIGGGSLFFNIHHNKENTKSVINDISSELIDSYNAIKINPKKMMTLLDVHEQKTYFKS